MFKGSIVAIVTPFMKGKVDEEGFRRLIEFQIENGIQCHRSPQEQPGSLQRWTWKSTSEPWRLPSRRSERGCR